MVSKDGLDEKSEELKAFLRDAGFSVFYDNSGSIGRRYRRMDEIGVPASITVDHKTLEDRTVTIRDRDSMQQVRVVIAELPEILGKFLSGTAI